ncbi:MAG: cation:proton antiporter [Hymenobacteraceae bacterium]|nr:cation:proton antiporter [Hymenobacteraceae bacterium]MDX5395224.1 cation:proton antiporter [Hymenobacteraceae bacterium]MDX5443212.1 cation:proton antiporter [Hymenobacteraceae bacterium]MDX5511262.1 cation:proton antiporter [Hymenobacteraceae bacterium]
MIKLASLLFLGILAQWLSWRIKIPSILPLIIIGLLVGPLSTLLTPDGSKFIDGDALFQGDFLFDFVSLSVGIILFEGGLTLKVREIKFLGGTVRNLIFIGALITFLGGAVAAYFLTHLGIRISFLFGALIIVTGPTVIAPLLRNVKPNPQINTVLKWEGILIDPLGALTAVLVYEFIVAGDTHNQFTFYVLKTFVLSVLTGAVIGILTAFLLYYLLRKNRIPKFLRNVVTLAIVVVSFALANFIHHESGLLSVTLAGIILANLKFEELHDILSFKEDIVIILLSLLFIILSSRMNLADFQMIGINGIWLFVVVVLVLRPLSVFLSTINSGLSLAEKIFISCISPRGIVAAGVASIFSLRLLKSETLSIAEKTDAQMLLPLTFLIIVGTVVTQSLYAIPLAKKLGVRKEKTSGILIIGADEASRYLGRFLQSVGVYTLMADVSHTNIAEARTVGLNTFEGDILSEDIYEEVDMSDFGYMLSITPNTELNIMVCRKYRHDFGEEHTLRIISKREKQIKSLSKPKNVLFQMKADFIELTQLVRMQPKVLEMTFEEDVNCEAFTVQYPQFVPLFIQISSGFVIPISGYVEGYKKGQTLYYIQK